MQSAFRQAVRWKMVAEDPCVGVDLRFRRLLAAAGIRSIRLYDLRHTAATLAVAAGVSVKVISDQLGRASISFTLERYSHVLLSIQDEAAAKVERKLMA
jgi:integrase